MSFSLNRKEGWRRIWLVATGFWSVGWFIFCSANFHAVVEATLAGLILPQVGIGIIYFFVTICLPWIREGFAERDTLRVGQSQRLKDIPLQDFIEVVRRIEAGNIVINNPDDIEYLGKIMGKAEERWKARDSEGKYS